MAESTPESPSTQLPAAGTQKLASSLLPGGAGPDELIAYRVSPFPAFSLARAPIARQWMEDTRERFANRCLPLLIANQSGWWALNCTPFRAAWTGGWDKACITVETLDGSPHPPCLSHFGDGVLTFHMPWLFRTPPGWNLWVRGPTNYTKDGLVALDGVVETDWSMATFTMNWRFTAKNLWVNFDVGEPICQLVPIRRGDLETLKPREQSIDEVPELKEAFMEWSDGRGKFLQDLGKPGTEATAERWQRHYFRGVAPDGSIAPEHQVKLNLREFEQGGRA
jgi:hypothetical protein